MKKGDLIYYKPNPDIGIFEKLEVSDTLWAFWTREGMLQNCFVSNTYRIGMSCLGEWT